MKFNPLTNELYSDEGQFLKQQIAPSIKTGRNWKQSRTAVIEFVMPVITLL